MVCSSEIRAVVNPMSVVDRGGGGEGGGGVMYIHKITQISFCFWQSCSTNFTTANSYSIHTELYSAGRFGKSYSTMLYQDCSKSLMGVHNPDMYFR